MHLKIRSQEYSDHYRTSQSLRKSSEEGEFIDIDTTICKEIKLSKFTKELHLIWFVLLSYFTASLQSK